ncbi:MAG: universal stress protein [Vicinamibacterales bacterium]|jgi:nucleotide-binding universal stress UspA family protein|nr:universal stress protein [Vicinamibacterales bacterium]
MARADAGVAGVGALVGRGEIDIIILGTHGRGAVTHMVLGSVAENVVRTAPCPVLTVRPAGHEFVMP